MSDNMQAFAHSQTRENLMRAFAGESQARNPYTIAAGIAHKEAGIGQVGAGTVRAPLACFEQALEALAQAMNIQAA